MKKNKPDMGSSIFMPPVSKAPAEATWMIVPESLAPELQSEYSNSVKELLLLGMAQLFIPDKIRYMNRMGKLWSRLEDLREQAGQ